MQTQVCDAVFFPHALSFIPFFTAEMFTLRNPSAIVLQRGEKKKMHGEHFVSFLVKMKKLHGKHTVEHLSVTAGWPVISAIKVFLP